MTVKNVNYCYFSCIKFFINLHVIIIPYTTPHSVTSHKTTIFIATGERNSNFAHKHLQFSPLSFLAKITSIFTDKHIPFTSRHRWLNLNFKIELKNFQKFRASISNIFVAVEWQEENWCSQLPVWVSFTADKAPCRAATRYFG